MTDQSKEILEIIKDFSEYEWSHFVRHRLELPDDIIDGIEGSSQHRTEIKHKTVRRWITRCEDRGEQLAEIMAKLRDMKEQLPPVISTVTNSPPTGDLDSVELAEHGKEWYPTEGKSGCALIISNSFRNSKSLSRVDASYADIGNMRTLWRNTLNCELYEGNCYENLTGKDMVDLLEKFSKPKIDYAYVVVVISTHGGVEPKRSVPSLETVRGNRTKIGSFFHTAGRRLNWNSGSVEVFFGEDKVKISENKILELFCNAQATKLKNVSKIFILDYCRGNVADQGVSKRIPRSNSKADGFVGGENRYQEDEIPAKSPIPTVSDTLTVYATHRDFAAFNDENGSLLLTEIKRVFEEHWKTKGVLEMLTMVNAAMKHKDFRGCKAMSVFHSSLEKDLKF